MLPSRGEALWAGGERLRKTTTIGVIMYSGSRSCLGVRFGDVTSCTSDLLDASRTPKSFLSFLRVKVPWIA